MNMYRKNKYTIAFLAMAICLCNFSYCFAQDSTKPELNVNVGYYMTGNKLIYLMVRAKAKINSKFQPISNSVISLYLDSVASDHFIAKVTTNDAGVAKAVITTSLKPFWDLSSSHRFIGIAEAGKGFDETKTETSVTRSKIEIDTLTDGATKNIKVTVSKFENNNCTPAKDVEMKVGIHRLGGVLSAGKEETYTTDSTGTVTVEFNKDSIPGDEKGNIALVAKVEDNDQFGNLLFEKTVPWGIALKEDKNFFDQRTLWSTKFRTPYWLLFLAYSIVIGVWGTLVYLVLQMFKVKKMGNSAGSRTVGSA